MVTCEDCPYTALYAAHAVILVDDIQRNNQGRHNAKVFALSKRLRLRQIIHNRAHMMIKCPIQKTLPQLWHLCKAISYSIILTKVSDVEPSK